MKKTVLITGGSGLVGSAINDCIKHDNILQDWADWIFIGSNDYDLRNYEQTTECFNKYKPTHVIHLAARVGGLFSNMKYKVEFYRDNIRINDNVMENCKIHHVEKLISCLSTCIFPDNTKYPIDENMIHSGPPHPSNQGYAYAKRMIDIMNHNYNDEYGCNFTSVIPTNIFGAYDNFSLENGHVIPNLIHKCYLAKRDNKQFIIEGSGKPLRQFIYNKDLAKLIIWTLQNYKDIDPIILSVDENDEISIHDVSYEIAHIFGLSDDRIIFNTKSADGQYKKTASNKKLRQYLPTFSFTPFDIALKETCHWFIENYEQLRK